MDKLRHLPAALYEGIETEIYNGIEMRHYKKRPNNLVELLEKSVENFANREAVVDEKARLTYQEFDRLSNNLSASLRDHGMAKGDRVAILMPNCWEYAVAYYGIIRLGGIAVLLNWRCTAAELEYMLNDSSSSFLLTTPKFYQEIADIIPNLKYLNSIYCTNDASISGTISFEKEVKKEAASRINAESPVIEDDVAAILYTSGTTGRPKGTLQTHRNCVANALNASKLAEADETDRTLIIAPMFHATGINSQLTAFLYVGGCSVIRSAFVPQDTLTTIQKEKISFGAGVAAMFYLLLADPKWKSYDLSSLRSFVFGGSNVPVELFSQILGALPNVKFGNVWGLTECTSITTWNPHEDILRAPKSVGPPVPILDVKVVDPQNNQDMPYDEVGELCVKGPSVVKGYWNKQEATRQTFVNGWLHTGDLGYMDEDGYIYVVDRIKDMIVSGGENIYCLEVENAIMQHPAVFEVGVVGVPDPVMQEAVKAVVFLKQGIKATEQEIIDHCKSLIASYKKPKYVVFTKEPLPRNPGGKLLKTVLKDM